MRNVIIFGAAKNGLKIKRSLDEGGLYKNYVFADNNRKKQKFTLDGIKILSFKEAIKLYYKDEYDSIIISLIKPDEIVDQIRESGISADVYGVAKEYFQENSVLQRKIEDYLYPIDVKKPRLNYFEYHISHHCNLQCKGCGHFSNIAEPEFGNFEIYKKDIKRLRELYWGVERIRLMGGEPLLNRELCQFIEITRRIFPDANIRVVTNGLLIPSIKEMDVLPIMKACNTGFDITQYPPTHELKEQIELICTENNVEFSFSPLVKKFFSIYNQKGNSDKERSYRECISKECHFLLNGKMSVCGVPILYDKYKNLLNYKLTGYEKDIIDIYEQNLDGFKLNTYLNNSINTCKYCDNQNKKWFDWKGHHPYID